MKATTIKLNKIIKTEKKLLLLILIIALFSFILISPRAYFYLNIKEFENIVIVKKNKKKVKHFHVQPLFILSN
jgi:hypothetical protein